jgi:hypothetical protein
MQLRSLQSSGEFGVRFMRRHRRCIYTFPLAIVGAGE